MEYKIQVNKQIHTYVYIYIYIYEYYEHLINAEL